MTLFDRVLKTLEFVVIVLVLCLLAVMVNLALAAF
jgi:hypothetical protein